ncbi:MAG: hypothetical protein IJ186_00865 [Bacilli bacterium]|nr:hypothetical protein [Bacilli bacterium]
MKKSLFLLALPVLMVLFGCNNSGSGMGTKTKVFAEDCLAHEEIFGKASELKAFNKAPQIKKAVPTVEHVGFQTLYDDENDKYHVRFIAKVADPDNITEATWTRNAYDSATGSSLGQSTKSPTGYYETVNDGGTPLVAGEGFGFVVYTLMDIGEEYKDDYIVVSLSLTNAEGTTISSTRVASADDTVSYTFARNETKFYLKKANGSPVPQDITTQGDKPENNFGSFSNIALNKDDKFFIFGQDATSNNFQVIKANGLDTGNAVDNYFFANDEGSIKANYKADYTLYLNNQGKIYVSAQNVVRPIYVKNDVWWWGADGRWTALYAFNDTTNRKDWFTFVEEGAYLKTAEIDPTLYQAIVLVEMKSGGTASWENQNESNQTSNLEFPKNNEDCLYLYLTNNNLSYSFGSR